MEEKIEFTAEERAVVEEDFGKYLQTVTLLARLHGVAALPVRVAEDRSGLIVTRPAKGEAA